MIVLDTNVVSELMRPEPAPQVAAWVRVRDRRELCMTSITLAEVRCGIARLPDGRGKQVLLDTADGIVTRTQSPRSTPTAAMTIGTNNRDQRPVQRS